MSGEYWGVIWVISRSYAEIRAARMLEITMNVMWYPVIAAHYMRPQRGQSPALQRDTETRIMVSELLIVASQASHSPSHDLETTISIIMTWRGKLVNTQSELAMRTFIPVTRGANGHWIIAASSIKILPPASKWCKLIQTRLISAFLVSFWNPRC